MLFECFDEEKDAMINPWDLYGNKYKKNMDVAMPKVAVACFERNVVKRLVEYLDGEIIAETKNANGSFPIYKVSFKGVDVAVYMADVGAACAGGQLEEIYALGAERVVVYGSCGVLYKEIEDCSVIIPDRAVREEGLSYHYVPLGQEVAVNPCYIPEFKAILEKVGVKYRIGKVWTTDAFYRETKTKVEKRKEQGCICVDMECSALAAVAMFREKELFQFFFSADCLDGIKWEQRSLGKDGNFQEKDLFSELALELAILE